MKIRLKNGMILTFNQAFPDAPEPAQYFDKAEALPEFTKAFAPIKQFVQETCDELFASDNVKEVKLKFGVEGSIEGGFFNVAKAKGASSVEVEIMLSRKNT